MDGSGLPALGAGQVAVSALAKEVRGGRVFYPVRVAIRSGGIARVKFCPGCGRDGIVGESAETSDFHVNSSHADGRARSWKPLCKKCYCARMREQRRNLSAEARRARDRANYAAARSDPARMEKLRVAGRKRYHRYLADPVKAEKLRAAQRRANAKRRPKSRRVVNEEQRLNYHLRRERNGRAQRVAAKWVEESKSPRLDAEPFREWLKAYGAVMGYEGKELAIHLCINERRLYSVLHAETPRVSLDIVDRALCRAAETVYVGGRLIVTLNDLYPLED